MAKQINEVLFENDDLIALNKPSGMLTIPDRAGNPSLRDHLLQRFSEIFTIHRLDRETSGLVLFAKNAAAHRYYSQLFEKRAVEKYYMAIVQGRPHADEGKMDSPIMEHPRQAGLMIPHREGKTALTTYTVIKPFSQYSLVLFQIHTGRTHQIRVHAKEAGFPVACDPMYGDDKPIFLSGIKRGYKQSKADEEEQPILNRLALHAHRLVFTDRQQNACTLEAPLPKTFTAVMKQLEKWSS